MSQPADLVLAAGSAYQVALWDLRGHVPWCKYKPNERWGRTRLIVYHHTASVETPWVDREGLLQRLKLVASVSPYGLPYNFVIGYAPDPVVCYLNDIDQAWPHTLGYNDAVAICALGNFEVEHPPDDLAAMMGLVADGLAVMWDRYVPEVAHRQIGQTACPGTYLFDRLQTGRVLEVPP